jgi:hypothetical protein
MTTAAQNAELAKAVCRTVYFLELQFASGTQYLNSTNVPLYWSSDAASIVDTGTAQAQSSLRFDGTNKQVSVAVGATNPELDISGDVTVEAFVNADSTGSTFAVVVRGGGGADERYGLFVDFTNARTSWESYSGSFNRVDSTASTLPYNQRVHIAAVRASNVVTLYVNGNVTGGPTGVAAPTVTAATLYVGSQGSQNFKGDIESPRVYSRALSAQEIREHALGIYLDDTGLKLHWPFDEGTGTSAADASGNGNNGALVNAPAWVTDLIVDKSIRLRAAASASLNAYKGMTVRTTGGTGSGQEGRIVSYNGASKVAYMEAPWVTNPDGTTTYDIIDLHTWTGLGTVIGMDAIEESDSLDAKALSFSLNHAQPSWLALSVGPVEDYRGLPAKLYFCPLDEGFQLVDTPELCWRGIMDTVTVGLEGEEGKITLKCETSAYALKRSASLRYNAAQQKNKYPADTGLDYLTDLIANPQLWLSKKFQQI